MCGFELIIIYSFCSCSGNDRVYAVSWRVPRAVGVPGACAREVQCDTRHNDAHEYYHVHRVSARQYVLFSIPALILLFIACYILRYTRAVLCFIATLT